jgi:G protein beta subunit-like protein
MPFTLHVRHWFLAVAALGAAVGAVDAADPANDAAPGGATLGASTRWVIAADTSRDGQTIVTAGGDSLLYRPGDVIAWKAADGTRLGEFAGHPTTVWGVKFSPDGTLLATAGYDGLVRIWDVATRQPKRDLEKHKGWVRAVAFSPDGARLVTASSDTTARLWDCASGEAIRVYSGHHKAATCCALNDSATGE